MLHSFLVAPHIFQKLGGGRGDEVDKFSDEDIYTCEGMSDFCQEA